MRMPEKIHMVGVGGIGMSALAQLLISQGKAVSGSDREESPATRLVAEKGGVVTVGQEQDAMPRDTELLIYSDAVPSENAEREHARKLGIPEVSYFEALGEISRTMRTIAVAGTHGKTTTTAMLAKILSYADKRPTAIVGSIVRDFESNFLAGREDLLVVEACEYRDHLLKLSPEILVITNIELDHTDYFPDLEALQETFRQAAQKVPAHGCIVTNPYDPVIAATLSDAKAPIIDYTTQTVPEIAQIGEFNRENARAAKAAARAAFPHLQEEFTDKALIDFKGSWRRFEYKGETPSGALVYDDYAHHPTAVEKTILAAREHFPEKHIVVVFHPHLYSRTRDLFAGFVGALALADRVILAPIYAAREENTHDISSQKLAVAIESLNENVVSLPNFDTIRTELLHSTGTNDLIITMGAGDIYKVAEQIVD
jgi:UDP-N-acetylmuramate--alanine ligase